MKITQNSLLAQYPEAISQFVSWEEFSLSEATKAETTYDPFLSISSNPKQEPLPKNVVPVVLLLILVVTSYFIAACRVKKTISQKQSQSEAIQSRKFGMKSESISSDSIQSTVSPITTAFLNQLTHTTSQRYYNHLPSSSATDSASVQSLHLKLVNLLSGDRAAAHRLVQRARVNYPDQSEQWLYEKVIDQLICDRR